MSELGDRREFETQTKGGKITVVIRDVATDKIVKIPCHIWLQMLKKFKKIIDRVSYFKHIDDGWCISFRKPFTSVNIRRFYFGCNGGLNPSKQGMSLRLSELLTLAEIKI